MECWIGVDAEDVKPCQRITTVPGVGEKVVTACVPDVTSTMSSWGGHGGVVVATSTA